MKRNEKILVYGVTGFLLAILVIAVVFGNEDLSRAVEARSQPEMPRTLQEVLTADPAEAQDSESGAPDSGAPETGTGQETTGLGAAGQMEAASQISPEPLEFIGPMPLVASLPAVETTALESSAEAISVLGKSRREGDYRIVTIQPRDTFSELVVRWCGSRDYEGRVERLNEGLVATTLQPGVDLWLPWVDDNVLLTAYQGRSASLVAAAEERTRRLGALYTLKRGDSLWKLAQEAAGLGGAPAYIERIKALNPDIADFDRLREGQQIRLPADR